MYADAGFGFAAAYSPALASSQSQPPPFDYAFSSAPAPPLLSMLAMDHDAYVAAAALPVPDLPAAHLVSNYSYYPSALLAASSLIADLRFHFPPLHCRSLLLLLHPKLLLFLGCSISPRFPASPHR